VFNVRARQLRRRAAAKSSRPYDVLFAVQSGAEFRTVKLKNIMNHLINYLSWSEQRAKLLYTCPKQYGYRFIESWEGWLPTATKSAQAAYRHNCLVSDLRLVTGSIIHDRCGRVLKRLAGGIISDPATETAIAEADFDNFLSNSAKLPLTALGSKRKKLIAHLLGKVVPPTLIASERAPLSERLMHA
jgi:hypothetical protein